jgi:uncharacterized membrane protein YhaH (DUF805 family)
MFKVLLGDIKNGRLKRLQYLGYTILLGVLMFGFGLAIVLGIGAGEHIIGGNLQQAQDQLREWFTLPFFIIFGPISVLFLFAGINIMAKRIRDIGLPGWWTTLTILVLEIIASLILSEQVGSGFHSLIWIVLLLVPTDTFSQRVQPAKS